jgi:hypothetical protein
MILTLRRRYKGDKYTIGSLYVDGKYVCDTIEDKDRGLSSDMPSNKINRIKVPGETAIPCGKYKIDMNTVSTRFRSRAWAKKYNGIVPRLIGVPCFGGVLIHVGNTEKESLGCPLVGENKVKGQVINSTTTFYKLMDNYLIPARHRGEEIWIEIV